MLNFPNAPADGEISAQPNGVSYQWDDTLKRWDSLSGKLPAVAGTVVQIKDVRDGESQTGTGSFTVSDAIPQDTDGDEFYSVVFTPKYATSTIMLDFNLGYEVDVSNSSIGMAVFQSGVSDALGVMYQRPYLNDVFQSMSARAVVAAGSTDARTYSLRAGSSGSNPLSINSLNGLRRGGGAMVSGLTITEIQPNAVQPEPVPPGIMLFGRVDGTGTGDQFLDGGEGMTLVRASAGKYDVTFDTPFPDTDYSANATLGNSSGSVNIINKLTTGFRVEAFNISGTAVDRDFEIQAVHQFAWPPLPTVVPDILYRETTSGGVEHRTTGGITMTKAGTGLYDYVFDTPQPDEAFNVQCTISGGSTGFLRIQALSLTGFRVSTFNSSAAATDRGHELLITRIAGATP